MRITNDKSFDMDPVVQTAQEAEFYMDVAVVQVL